MPKLDNNRKVGHLTKAALERASTTHEHPLIPDAQLADAARRAKDENVGGYSSGEGKSHASLQTALAGNNNDLRFDAVVPGPDGNDVTVAYVDPAGNDAVLSVDVTGTDIVVNLATDGASAPTSTAADVRDAVNEDPDASDLVAASNKAGNDGTGVVTALAETALTGGTD